MKERKKAKNKKETNMGEARSRDITFIHTGGQMGPRWRASLGKSGPKIPVFLHFYFVLLSSLYLERRSKNLSRLFTEIERSIARLSVR